MPDHLTPTIEAKISLARLSHNLARLKKAVGPKVTVMAVVKSNAYGHGLVPISHHLWSEGVSHFAVARLEEALALRAALPQAAILILSPVLPDNFPLTVKHQLTLTVTEKDHFRLLAKIASQQQSTAKVHLKVDTGLNRSGAEPAEALALAQLADTLPNLDLEGVFTHFANAGTDRAFTLKQLAVFNKFLASLKKRQPLPRYIHAAATAAIFNFPESHFNLVRPGLSLYGHFPDDGQSFGLKPILSLFTRLSRIHPVKKNETVGYNRTYRAARDLIAATLYAGYADGLRRAPQSWPYVGLGRQTAPIIGRMSMDQAVIDISQIRPRPTLRTKVLLIDNRIGRPLSLETIAAKIGTSTYEVLTSLAERIGRTYC